MIFYDSGGFIREYCMHMPSRRYHLLFSKRWRISRSFHMRLIRHFVFQNNIRLSAYCTRLCDWRISSWKIKYPPSYAQHYLYYHLQAAASRASHSPRPPRRQRKKQHRKRQLSTMLKYRSKIIPDFGMTVKMPRTMLWSRVILKKVLTSARGLTTAYLSRV